MEESLAEAAVVAQAELDTPPGGIARLILDLGCPDTAAAAVTRALATGVLAHLQALIARPASDLPADLREALGALADALADVLSEQTAGRTAGEATVTALDTPLARAWHAHPAGWDR